MILEVLPSKVGDREKARGALPPFEDCVCPRTRDLRTREISGQLMWADRGLCLGYKAGVSVIAYKQVQDELKFELRPA